MAALRRLPVEIPAGEIRRCARQPAVDERLSKRPHRDCRQLDKYSRVPVEVRNREERCGLRSEYGLLLPEILYSYRQDRPIGWDCVAEPLEISLGERPFPRECLAGHGPGSAAMTFAFRHLGQLQGNASHIIDSRHPRTVEPSTR